MNQEDTKKICKIAFRWILQHRVMGLGFSVYYRPELTEQEQQWSWRWNGNSEPTRGNDEQFLNYCKKYGFNVEQTYKDIIASRTAEKNRLFR